MHITTLEEYGIRCAIQLAKLSINNDKAIRTPQIAEREGLSNEYVSKIMQLFRKEGLVSSVRGNQGGFVLARKPKQISLKIIMDSLQPSKDLKGNDEFCELYKGLNEECAHNCDCPLRPVWTMLFSYFDEVLNAVSLDDLLVKEKDSEKLIQTIAFKQSKQVIKRIKAN